MRREGDEGKFTVTSKNTPPLFAHYFEVKVGSGRLLEY